jgi:hypothetical protein
MWQAGIATIFYRGVKFLRIHRKAKDIVQFLELSLFYLSSSNIEDYGCEMQQTWGANVIAGGW